MVCTDIFPLKANTYMGTALLLLTFDACWLKEALHIYFIYRSIVRMHSKMKYSAAICAVLMATEIYLEALLKAL